MLIGVQIWAYIDPMGLKNIRYEISIGKLCSLSDTSGTASVLKSNCVIQFPLMLLQLKLSSCLNHLIKGNRLWQIIRVHQLLYSFDYKIDNGSFDFPQKSSNSGFYD